MYGAAPVISGESGDVSGLVTLSDGYGEENGGEEDNGEDGLLSLLTPEPEVVLQDDAPVSNDSIWHVRPIRTISNTCRIPLFVWHGSWVRSLAAKMKFFLNATRTCLPVTSGQVRCVLKPPHFCWA